MSKNKFDSDSFVAGLFVGSVVVLGTVWLVLHDLEKKEGKGKAEEEEEAEEEEDVGVPE